MPRFAVPLAALTGALLLAQSAPAQTLASLDRDTVRRGAGRSAARVVEGVRVGGVAVTVDGRLDEAAWAGAAPAGNFVQTRPAPGEAASQSTEARVLYDDEAVYVALRMHDRAAGEIASQLSRRDASGIHSDWAHVLIDSYHDRRTGFRFSVNPHGVQKDVLHYDDHSEDVNWDAVWSAAATQDSAGWTAEFRIPLSQLRFDNQASEPVWGINFGREIARTGEWAWWSPVLPNGGGVVSQAGELRGLRALAAPRRLEVMPYSVARVTRAPGDAGNPFYRATDPGVAVGGDVRYGVTSNMTLSATLNPDFGQVEADPSEVNLSAFESFFAEKRPFFMEGANIFSFGIGTDDGSGEQLFYSRRIGRAPQRSVDAGDGWVDRPEATTILGAAKLTGKTASGWTVGLLDAVTAREDARVASPAGAVHTEAVEPATNYLVGSLSRDFREGRSGIGIMGTATHRRLGDGAEFEFLRSAAYSGGIRARHRFSGEVWEANGYLGASHIQGSDSAIARVQRGAGHYFQRPDAAHLEYDPTRTSLSGVLGSFWVGKNGGSKLRGGFGGHLRTPGFEVNDLGFQGEADQVQLYTSWRWQQFEPVGPFRSFTLGVNPFSAWTTDGERTFSQVGHWGNVEFHNLWNGGWWVGRRLEALSNSALRGGPAIVRPSGLRYSTWWNTDRRRALSFGANAWGGWEDEGDGWDAGVSTSVQFRPSPQLNVALSPSYRRNHNSWQYVTQKDALGERRYLFGLLEQRTASVTARVNYTISPTLSLEVYAQPFVSAGDYGEFKQVADPRAARFQDRFRPFGPELTHDPEAAQYAADLDGDAAADLTFGDPDFNFKQLRGNAVLRWEYRPGSALFVVWSQGRTDSGEDGTFDFSRDFGRLLGAEGGYDVPSTNVLLIKASYWMNF